MVVGIDFVDDVIIQSQRYRRKVVQKTREQPAADVRCRVGGKVVRLSRL